MLSWVTMRVGSSDYGGGEVEMLLLSEAKRASGRMDFRFLNFEFMIWDGGMDADVNVCIQ